MNISVALLLFLAWQMLGKNKSTPNLSSLLSGDAQSLLDVFQKLTDKNSAPADKTQSILSVLGNQTVMDAVGGLFGGKSEGVSAEAKSFFSPVEKIAGKEVSDKLYSFYDNWYVKNG